MRGESWAVAALFVLASSAAPAAEPPRVVTSLLPLQSLAASVLNGIALPEVLVRDGGSEHAYAMKPSDARALHGADLVIWVGHELEMFLEKPLATLPRPETVLAVAELPGVMLLPTRRGEGWGPEHEHSAQEAEHEAEAEHEHEHQHGANDMHLWLDPENAIAIVAAIAERLSRIDPARSERYRQNAEGTIARIRALDSALMEELAPVRDVPFIVFHDAYQYFERRYGLTAVGAVAIDPERPPGARHVAELRRHLAERRARCIFAEPQFSPDLVATLREGTSLQAGTLDPLGSGFPAGPGQYEALMHGLAASLRACLGTS